MTSGAIAKKTGRSGVSYMNPRSKDIAKLHRISEAESLRFRGYDLRRSSTPRFIFGSKTTLWNIASAGISAWTRGSCTNWLAFPDLKQIAEQLGSYPRVLVHRDFQSQNIIIRQGQAYLIDFQGMRPGLAEYDLASILYDPYVHLTGSERAELRQFYRSTAEVNDPVFDERFRLCAMQRIMQALGAYAFLGW